jgi:lipopolysaccharide biosynthesis regulator YciM
VHQAHLELARDYISAGLFDRAERLLLDLVKDAPEQRRASQRHLLEIFQSQREWSNAIEVATALLPRKSLLGSASTEVLSASRQPVAVVLAHYHCELAAELVAAGNIAEARNQLQLALSRDRNCVRASIMLGQLECQSGHYRQALKVLRKVRQQDADYIPETLPTLRECYRQLDDGQAMRRYLEDCLQASPSAPLVLAVGDDIRQQAGDDAAAEFLSEQLTRHPSLSGLAGLISLQIGHVEGRIKDNLGVLEKLVQGLIAERPTYRCSHCGFAGRQLHWFCPGCKHWGTVKALFGNHVG